LRHSCATVAPKKVGFLVSFSISATFIDVIANRCFLNAEGRSPKLSKSHIYGATVAQICLICGSGVFVLFSFFSKKF
jgi:hypothetical protein